MLKLSRNAGEPRGGSRRLARPFVSGPTVRIAGNRPSLRPGEDIRLAQLWLADHALIADVITVIEVRHRFELSSADCRDYAVEIVRAAQTLSRSESEPIPNPKEFHHALA